MVSDFLQLIDRLIQLKQYRDTRLQTVFEKIIEPTFNETLLAHRNYIELFEELIVALGIDSFENFNMQVARGMWPHPTIPLAEIPLEIVRHAAERLRQRRIEFEPVRRKLASLANEIDGLKDISIEVTPFINAFRQYFPSGEALARHGTLSQAILEDLDRWINYSAQTESLDPWIGKYSDPSEASTYHSEGGYAGAVLRSLQATLRLLRMRWAIMCEAFATLKLYVYTHK